MTKRLKEVRCILAAAKARFWQLLELIAERQAYARAKAAPAEDQIVIPFAQAIAEIEKSRQ